MKKHTVTVILVLSGLAIWAFAGLWQSGGKSALAGTDDSSAPDRIAVVWTSGDPEVAHRVCLMYTHGTCKAGWFKETLLIIWGPSARLLAADKDLQLKVKEMMADGIQVKACVVCADSYGVSDWLREFGVEVLPMGAPLTRLLKSPEWEVLTF